MKGRVLIIAGSDSGGGAGIQADIKTVTALGAYAATAITALTAQDTKDVHGIHEVPPEFVAQQIAVVLDDIGADVIKTGMLHRVEIVMAVLDALDAHGPAIPLVVDPVMVAKGGARLLDPATTSILIERLLPRATVLTPNLPEAEILSGLDIKNVDDMHEAGVALRARGAEAVVMKGGHLPGARMTDLLLTADGVEAFADERIETRHTHGTGCSLASAIAAGLAQGLALGEAVWRARDYVRQAIATAPGFGAGHGPLNHGHVLERDPERDPERP